MTAHIPGELAILFAMACNVVAGLAFFMVARGNRSYENLARTSYHVFTLSAGFAVVWLYMLFFTHNYAFKYVYEYSQRSQSLFYIISAFWGGQEGTYLLWLFLNAAFGYILIFRGGQYKNWGMAIFTLVNFFFLLILIKLSPFALLPTPQPDGLGLNPLLTDPWMVVHPPVVFVAYSMAALPFVIAMAALITRDFSGWLRRAFPWVAVTSLFLAGGNILGGFWAYKTLGWGGFWAWDPVENSSFIPWVISLALLHGMIIERRSGALRKINLMLASFVFMLVVYGTFLTRSGVLADFSVHSFTDLGLNNLLVAFMGVMFAVTVFLLARNWRAVPTEPLNYNYYGREFALFAGMTMLSIFGIIVLFWTSLPILTNLVGAEPRAANPETYNNFALPLSILMSFLLTISPFVQFNEFKLSGWMQKFIIVLAAATVLGLGVFVFGLKADLIFAAMFILVVTGMAMYLFRKDLLRLLIPSLAVFAITIAVGIVVGVTNYLFLLFFATAMMAATSNVIHLFGFIPGRWKLMGGQLTHFGFGLMLVGILASGAFTSSEKLVLPKGEAGKAFDLNIQYTGMAGDIKQPHNELILLVGHETNMREVRPQLYFSERMQGIMRKPYIERTFLADIYMAPEQIQEGSDQDGLVIAKGETKKLGNLEITFRGYSMAQHGNETTGGMRVAAVLDINEEGVVTTVEPAVEHSQDSEGNTVRKSVPAQFAVHDHSHEVAVEQILADEGAVMISIPGMTNRTPERLVIDISRKPLINFVWGGAILIILGSAVSFIRRREEMAIRGATKPASVEQVPERARG